MNKTINGLFEKFMKEKINLDPNRMTIAKSSKAWLEDTLKNIAEKDPDFPKLYGEIINFGSFARKTKISPIDDIDIMVCLSAENGYYTGEPYKTQGIRVCVENKKSILKSLCNEGTCDVNSIKVINRFIQKLSNPRQYQEAEIHRNQEAMTLKLKTREWNFDIVPCFLTEDDFLGKSYYLIPDGSGMWKKTDPRIDKTNVTDINKKIDGKLLEIIRLVKYWNKNAQIKKIPSYLLENIIINFYRNSEYTKDLKVEFCRVLCYLSKEILCDIEDPKGIQGNLNTLENEERQKISENIKRYLSLGYEAILLEKSFQSKKAVENWKVIFGKDFPNYE